MKVGVLALQGAFREHQKIFHECGVDTIQVRMPEHLNGIDALVIPGGESTTMGKLLKEYRLFDQIIDLGNRGLPVMGTCAGLILMAKEIAGSSQPRLGFMDINVERNAFGRQVNSFEADLEIKELGPEPLRAVFIRAPYVIETSENVDILAKYKDKIVCVKQDNFMAAAFHPELTADYRLHKYFLDKIVQ